MIKINFLESRMYKRYEGGPQDPIFNFILNLLTKGRDGEAFRKREQICYKEQLREFYMLKKEGKIKRIDSKL